MAAEHRSHGTDASFRGLIILHRGRTELTQRQVAARLQLNERSIQAWEAGVSYPSSESLRALIALYLASGGFAGGQELPEATSLWAAAQREAPRMRSPFDPTWFAQLIADTTAVPSSTSVPTTVQSLESRQDWSDAPDISTFVGRERELRVLRESVHDGCRVLAVLGLGGIGKTTLASRLAHDLAPGFERVYWRSVRSGPLPMEWLGGAIGFLSDQEVLAPDAEAARLSVLLGLLRSRRCLLVLDNLEVLLEPGDSQGRYRPGYEGYGSILETLGQTQHRGCVIVTSREGPPELGPPRGDSARVRAWELGGLSPADGQALLREKRLHGDSAGWTSLIERYGGNALALKMVGESIRQVFRGAIHEFLHQADSGGVFGGIRRLLDSQFERLSPLEHAVLAWLAIEREAITFNDIIRDLGSSVSRNDVLEAVEALRRRSMLEQSESDGSFTLQSVVLEYVADRLVDSVAREIELRLPRLLVSHALVKAQAKDYVRQAQERLIAEPILRRLIGTSGSRATTEHSLIAILEDFRLRARDEHQFGPGNVINLLRLLRGDLRGLDLSRLAIRQTFLPEIEAQDTNLAGSNLAETVFAEPFNYPTSLGLSGNGRYVAAGTSTGEVCLWRVFDRALATILHGPTGGVTALALGNGGQYVAAGAEDGSVHVWVVEDEVGRLAATLMGHFGTVRGVALDDDRRLLVSGGEDSTLRIWDIVNGRLLATLEGHTRAIWAVALARGGRLLASGGNDERVCLWDVDSGRPLAVLDGHTGGVRGVALTPDGSLMATAAADGTLRLWDPDTHECRLSWKAHADAVMSVALSQDGRRIGSASLDGTVRLWEAPAGRALAILQGHTSGAWGVAVSEPSRVVASSGFDATVRLWNADDGRPIAVLQGRGSGILGVALSATGQLVASASFDGIVRLWDTLSGEQVSALVGHTSGVRSVALSRDGRLLASASLDGTVRLWELATGQVRSVLHGHVGGVWGVTISADGSRVLSAGLDGTVQLWDAAAGAHLLTLPGHANGAWGAELSPDHERIISSGFDGGVYIWDGLRGTLLSRLNGHSASGRGLALSMSGDFVAVGASDGKIRLWRPGSGRLMYTLDGHVGQVNGVALDDSSKLMASAGFDGTVRLWRIGEDGGRALAILRGSRSPVWSVTLSGAGAVLASGGDDGVVRVWDPSNGQCMRALRADRRYERLDITGATGITEVQRRTLLALGAIDRARAPSE
jgi:WD40 repeat protein